MEQGRVTHTELTGSEVLTFCMRPDNAEDEVADACFEWQLGTRAFRLGKAPSAPPMPEPPPASAGPRVEDVVPKAVFPRTEEYRAEADGRRLGRFSADGKQVALIRQRVGAEHQAEVEVWGTEQKKRLSRFKVTSTAHADQIDGLRFVGPTLLVEQCDAGPACTGRLFDPTNGKLLLEVPINFYGAEISALEGTRWLFVDGWLRGASIVDVAEARVVGALESGVSGPAESAGRALRVGKDALVFVLSGAGESPELAHGGMLVRLSLEPGGVVQRFAAPACGE
jgi:hypothetical protein